MIARRAKRGVNQHRLHRRGLWLFGAAALVVIMIADQQGRLFVRQADDLTAYHGVRCHVIRVVDGDTLEVDIPDVLRDRPASQIVLIGVNCPEPARANRPPESLANEATEFVQRLVADQPVTLWMEAHQTRDRFGRVWVHVELADRTKLNDALLEAGLARADDRLPHSMLTRHAQLQLNAQRRGVGVWAVSAAAE